MSRNKVNLKDVILPRSEGCLHKYQTDDLTAFHRGGKEILPRTEVPTQIPDC